jgi:hypothetical protein
MKLSFYVLLLSTLICSCDFQYEYTDLKTERTGEELMNGVNFVAPPKKIDGSALASVKTVNAGWVAITPFGFTQKGSNRIQYSLDWQWWGERKDGAAECIKMAKQHNLKVMVKPQLWIQHGSYTGDFSLNSKKDWKKWESDYENFILDFAKISDSLDVEILCIGTELRTFVKQREQFWAALIPKIKKVYSGKLTYAGNWDAYDDFPFWKELDYIGIDAYFPLSDSETPEVEELLQGWEKHYQAIKFLQKQEGKPVLFTEYGYRSTDYTCKEPWDSGKGGKVNLKAQSNATEAIYQRFWNEDWFVGGFLWKWHSQFEVAGGKSNNRFTPQNKPVEDVIRKWYGGKDVEK